jgi:hypothetical protein
VCLCYTPLRPRLCLGAYDGEWNADGEKHGQGQEHWKNGDWLVGEWKNGVFIRGRGMYRNATEGLWAEGEQRLPFRLLLPPFPVTALLLSLCAILTFRCARVAVSEG